MKQDYIPPKYAPARFAFAECERYFKWPELLRVSVVFCRNSDRIERESW